MFELVCLIWNIFKCLIWKKKKKEKKMTMTEGLLYLYAKHTFIWIICSSVTERWSVWVCRGCECLCVRPYWPSVLIFRAVLTRANRVALKVTVPSLFRGMFMATSLCKKRERERQSKRQNREENTPDGFCVCVCTLQATRWGQSFPNPSGGWILLSKATTSKCLIRPLENKHTFNQT